MSIELSMKQQMAKQAIMRIATMGSVGAGKTKLNEVLTAVNTLKHQRERLQGTTINMGHAELYIYRNIVTNEFVMNPLKLTDDLELIMHHSIGDNPGHKSYTAALISGASAVDIILFAVSAEEGIVGQTKQHGRVAILTGTKELGIIITKTDLIATKKKMEERVDEIYNLFEEIGLDDDIDPPIIPISTVGEMLNIDKVVKYLATIKPNVQLMQVIANKEFKLPIIRSFDVNKPGCKFDEIKGGVIGGSIHSGHVCIGDVIGIFPGRINGKKYMPYVTKVVNINTGKFLDTAIPGGFIGIETTLDAGLMKANGMVGQTAIHLVGPDLKDALKKINGTLTNKIVITNVVELMEVNITTDSVYILMIDGISTRAKAIEVNEKLCTFELFGQPVFIIAGDKVAIMNIELDLIAHGIANNSKINNLDYIIDVQEDLYDYLDAIPSNVFSKQCSRKLILKNDIPEKNINTEYLLDTDALIDALEFKKSTYSLDFIPVELEKTTTSIAITNPVSIFSPFTDNENIMIQIFKEFAKHVQTNFDLLQTRRILINVESDRIVYLNVKRTTKDFYVHQFNNIIASFVKTHFSCVSCKAVGSIFKTKNHVKCKACGAVTSQK